MDIKRLAKAAGMLTEFNQGAASCAWTPGCNGVGQEELEKFAGLVAAVEREALAKAEAKRQRKAAKRAAKVGAGGTAPEWYNAKSEGAEPLLAKLPLD